MRLLRLAIPLALLVSLLPAFSASAAETTVIESGSSWRFDDNGTDRGSSWTARTYDDSSWDAGETLLGFGDGEDTASLLSKGHTTYYFRKSFSLADASSVNGLELSALVDDGAVVYLNGVEVWRTANVPQGQDFSTLTTSFVAGEAEEDWTTAEISPSALVSGTNVIAVEVHQFARFSSDVKFDFSLRASTETTEGAKTPTTAVCKITDSRLKEISGLAASVHFPDVLWANNDSGDTNRIFAVDANTCAVRAVVTLSGAKAYDYESISMGRTSSGEPEIWVGDTGNNSKSRSSVELYRFDEPDTLVSQTVSVKTVTVRWSDGARDSESMFVDPVPGGRVFLLSKEAAGGVYELQGDYRSTGSAATGTRIGTTLATATDASVAPDRSRTIVRNYSTKASLLSGVPGTNGQAFAIPSEPQGEAITFSADSEYVYIASEGVGNALYRIPV